MIWLFALIYLMHMYYTFLITFYLKIACDHLEYKKLGYATHHVCQDWMLPISVTVNNAYFV